MFYVHYDYYNERLFKNTLMSYKIGFIQNLFLTKLVVTLDKDIKNIQKLEVKLMQA